MVITTTCLIALIFALFLDWPKIQRVAKWFVGRVHSSLCCMLLGACSYFLTNQSCQQEVSKYLPAYFSGCVQWIIGIQWLFSGTYSFLTLVLDWLVAETPNSDCRTQDSTSWLQLSCLTWIRTTRDKDKIKTNSSPNMWKLISAEWATLSWYLIVVMITFNPISHSWFA